MDPCVCLKTYASYCSVILSSRKLLQWISCFQVPQCVKVGQKLHKMPLLETAVGWLAYEDSAVQLANALWQREMQPWLKTWQESSLKSPQDMNGCWNREMSLPLQFMFLLSAEPELPAWLVRGLTVFLSAGRSGTWLLNSFCIAKTMFYVPLLAKLFESKHTQCTVHCQSCKGKNL